MLVCWKNRRLAVGCWFSGVRMKFIAVVLFLYFSSVTDGKTIKKFKDESAILNKKLIGKSKPLPPAIIAIEIVDPNENKTKNHKRTIDSSLGYGYQSPPKYQVYKYSQHDIPPYRGPPNILTGGIKSHQYDFQKSVSYHVPSQSHKSQNLNHYYQPGTTLYSTVNNHGQAESLSTHLPQSYANEPQVPVIILRVYPNQLNDPSAALHANLPQNHPLASVVNSIDIQGLLSKYVQNVLVDQHQPQYQQYEQPHQQYEQPQQQYEQPHQQYEQPQEYQNTYQYVQQPEYHNYQAPPTQNLLTHENYPKETHTRVVFRTDKNHLGISPPTKNVKIAIPDGAYSAVQVQTPDMHYGYTSPGDGSTQQYYYQQSDLPQNYYYQSAPGSGYEQAQEPQQQLDYVPSPPQNETPYNYHAHQKRSKKRRFTRIKPELKVDDVIKLEPIRA